MVVVALAMRATTTSSSRTRSPASLPSFLVNPTEGLEDTASARSRAQPTSAANPLTASAPRRRAAAAAASGAGKQSGPGKASGLPVLGTAPEFVGNQHWFNTPGDKPLTLRSLRGRVVLVDFWTYSCINCLRTLPYLTAWDRTYRKDGLTIVGVHSPEFPFEKDAGNVAEAIERNGIEYPVAQDNDLATWNAYGNQYWPSEYFIDAKGKVRFAHFGEGEYGEKEKVIRELLAEAGPAGRQARLAAPTGSNPRPAVTTPETYLGAARAERFTNPMLSPGLHDFGKPPAPPPNEFAYGGKLADLARVGDGRGRLARPQLRRPPRLPGARLPRGQPRRCGCCSTASRSRRASPAPTSTAASVDGRPPAPLRPRRPAQGRTPRPHAWSPKRG